MRAKKSKKKTQKPRLNLHKMGQGENKNQVEIWDFWRNKYTKKQKMSFKSAKKADIKKGGHENSVKWGPHKAPNIFKKHL